MDIYEVLKILNIKFEEIEHEAVFTVEEANKLKRQLFGISLKNLFLVTKQKEYFLISLKSDKRLDLKKLKEYLKVSHLSFASEEELFRILKLKKGSVTPLAIINDQDNRVKVLLDKEIKDKKVLVHPNVNTKTLSIEYKDLIKVIEFTNHDYELIEI